MSEQSIYRSEKGKRQVLAFYDDMLAKWPVPYRSHPLTTRHGATFVLESGKQEATPVVLLHGANSNALAWMGEVEELSRDFRVLAVDIPGEPGRSQDCRLPLAGAAMVEWLGDTLDGLGVSSAMLVGLSLGGWTALRFATAHPERVDRLVLLAPGGVAPVRASFLAMAILLGLLGRLGYRAALRLTIGREKPHPTAMRFMDLIMTNVRPRVEPLPLCSDVELRWLEMPVLLLAGGRDPIVNTQATAKRLGALLPSLVTRVFPAEGHVLVGHGGLIARFLSGHEAV